VDASGARPGVVSRLPAGPDARLRQAIRAAGGIISRPGPEGRPELVVVHRPEHDDWTLPKGKLVAGESVEEGALREVLEETGQECEIERPAGCTSYIDDRGRDKIVCYWMMRSLGGQFAPSEEVDEMRWLTVEAARLVLTYPVDRLLLSVLDLG
jgi:8-oxo-dGTP diphosphatase